LKLKVGEEEITGNNIIEIVDNSKKIIKIKNTLPRKRVQPIFYKP